jgi:putative phage-type endonuclease
MTFLASQHDTDQSAWIAERNRGLGSSDMAVVLGLSKYKGPLRLWYEKTGRMLPEDISQQPQIKRGHRLEPVIGEMYEEETGHRIHRVNRIQQHKDHAWMLSSPDFETYSVRRNVECKTVSFFDPAEWGPSGSDLAPTNYVIQVQHQKAVRGFNVSDIAALGGWDFRIITIQRDDDIINFIYAEGERFWWHVQKDEMPTPKTIEDVKLRYPKSLASPIDATPEIIAAVRRLREVKASAKASNAELDELELEIKQYMGECDTLRSGSETLVAWRTSKPSPRIKEKALKEGDPATFALWAEERTTRPLLVKGVPE